MYLLQTVFIRMDAKINALETANCEGGKKKF